MISPGAVQVNRTVIVNGSNSQGVVLTPLPTTLLQCEPGPETQFHQFSVALTVPAPRLSTPMLLPLKSLKCTSRFPAGTLNATLIDSSLKSFCSIMMPVTGAVEKILMPVGPDVAASAVSAAFPWIWLPIITLSFRLIPGAGGGADAWLCIVTPGSPLL